MTAPHNTAMTLASYQLNDGVATITMDDGKVNALSPKMLADVTAQLERAAADEVGVVLTGRARTFSAGFDVRCEQARWPEMVAAGAALAERIMSFPAPVVVACNGNAIAMGAFLLLSGDHRIGARGDFRIGLNEVAIGLTIPWFGIEIARHRLTPPYFDRCTITGALLGPDEATTAGFLDEVAPPDELASSAHAAALAFTSIDRGAHTANKLRVRQAAISGVRDGIDRVKSGNREW
jgi:enoyl-CoA hydratase